MVNFGSFFSIRPISMAVFLLVGLTSGLAANAAPPVAQTPPRQPTTIQLGFQSMYNLDFQGAHQQFDAWERQHPQDPMGPVSHAAAFLFDEFARLGVLESELFVDDHTFDARKKLVPDPQVKARFESALSDGDRLALSALSKQPTDPNAEFARVLAMGLRSDYAALIEKRDLAALSYTKQGRQLAEQLLKEKPDDYDAYLAVGVENYLAGIKPAPVRWMLQIGGVQADKQHGIDELHQAALHGDLLAPFAKLLLAVAALRDKDTATACSLLQGLSDTYPKNPLYSRELYRCH
jgi:hypothetical protein